MLAWRAERRARDREQADRIEAVARGYGGVRSKGGLQAMEQELKRLRAD